MAHTSKRPSGKRKRASPSGNGERAPELDDADIYEMEHPESGIHEEIRRMEIRDAAKQIVAKRKWNRSFRPPDDVDSLTDELAIKDEKLTWSVDRLHVRGGNTTIAAKFKSGKTTLLVNLVRSLVDGIPFLGRFEVDPPDGNVAIWNYELSRVQFRHWLAEIGIKNTDRVIPLTLRGIRLPLLSPLGEEWAIQWLQTHDVAGWIIDPFGRAYAGPENDNTAIDDFVEALDYIKAQAGVVDLFMSVHTGRKDDERARGGTRIDDWPDHLWVLTRDGRDRNFGAQGRDVEVEACALQFDEASRELSLSGTTREDQRALRHAHHAVDALRAGPIRTKRSLRDAMKGDSNFKDAGIALAERNEWIEHRPDGSAHVYQLLRPPAVGKVRISGA